MTIALPPWLGFVILFTISTAAFLRGDWEERIAAGCLLMNVTATVVMRDRTWQSMQWAGFGADLVQLAVLMVIAFRTTKFWPLAAAGFHLLTVLTHIAKLLDPNLHQWAYITAIVIWTYLLIAALGVGTWNAWRAKGQPATSEAPAPTRR